MNIYYKLKWGKIRMGKCLIVMKIEIWKVFGGVCVWEGVDWGGDWKKRGLERIFFLFFGNRNEIERK